ncbi:hypothetical protein P154DRAFT_317152 [Amniculicola lignicola CBS 123094]|uniref:Uncharacterized protein n=1 Tax=Amniculicola lignicola CBS 123094 TaxID=1392246 RepID=A0A6A5WZT3_9PLEO|nr:hypothetical protein P154DRAFT_317152 [Amniculicola lignicola CBS 123094]
MKPGTAAHGRLLVETHSQPHEDGTGTCHVCMYVCSMCLSRVVQLATLFCQPFDSAPTSRRVPVIAPMGLNFMMDISVFGGTAMSQGYSLEVSDGGAGVERGAWSVVCRLSFASQTDRPMDYITALWGAVSVAGACPRKISECGILSIYGSRPARLIKEALPASMQCGQP